MFSTRQTTPAPSRHEARALAQSPIADPSAVSMQSCARNAVLSGETHLPTAVDGREDDEARPRQHPPFPVRSHLGPPIGRGGAARSPMSGFCPVSSHRFGGAESGSHRSRMVHHRPHRSALDGVAENHLCPRLPSGERARQHRARARAPGAEARHQARSGALIPLRRDSTSGGAPSLFAPLDTSLLIEENGERIVLGNRRCPSRIGWSGARPLHDEVQRLRIDCRRPPGLCQGDHRASHRPRRRRVPGAEAVRRVRESRAYDLHRRLDREPGRPPVLRVGQSIHADIKWARRQDGHSGAPPCFLLPADAPGPGTTGKPCSPNWAIAGDRGTGARRPRGRMSTPARMRTRPPMPGKMPTRPRVVRAAVAARD